MLRTHIGHIALRASDPETSASFLSDILGLRRTIVTDDEIMLSCNEKHHEVQLLAGAGPGRALIISDSRSRTSETSTKFATA